MIPEEYGGAGLRAVRGDGRDDGGDQRAPAATPAHCHAQMYNHGHAASSTARKAQKDRYLPKIASGELRLQSIGRDRADHRHRHHQAQDDGP
jgi:acyl-CoA dehydrogenase